MAEKNAQNQNAKIGKLFLQSLGRKDDVIKFLRQKCGIPINPKANYSEVIKVLQTNKVMGTAFLSEYNCATFDELCERFATAQGLSILYPEEFKLVVNWLRDNGHRALLQKKGSLSRNDQIGLILKEVTPAECRSAFMELTIKKSIRPVQQDGYWILGPLGVELSIFSRKTGEVDDLIAVFSKVTTDRLPDFADQLGFKKMKLVWGRQNQPEFRLKLLQYTLTYSSNKQIIDAINYLIDLDELNIQAIENIGRLTVTPFGIFERRYVGEEQLATLLINHIPNRDLESVLTDNKLDKGPFPFRVMELCLISDPIKILNDLFGLTQLRSVAKELGLVRVDKDSDKSKLINVVLWRLGFLLPPELVGIQWYLKNLDEYARQMREVRISSVKRRGIMMAAFTDTEAIFKQMLTFYVSVLLKVKKTLPFERQKRSEAIDEFIKNDLGFQFRLNESNLGQLFQAMNKLNALSLGEDEFGSLLKSYFDRTQVLPDGGMKYIDLALPKRKLFEHNVKQATKNFDIPDSHECSECLSQLLNFAKFLVEKSIYPSVVRLELEVRDRYGRRYLEAIDDDGQNFRITSDEHPSMGLTYFMKPNTNPMAMQPLLIEKHI
jgi:hypothetical protein